MSALCWVVIASVVLAVVGNLVYDEIRARLPWIPRVLLRIAALRLPASHRQDYRQEWRGELDTILDTANRLPLTAVWRGSCFAFGMLGAVEGVRRSLGPTNLGRWAECFGSPAGRPSPVRGTARYATRST